VKIKLLMVGKIRNQGLLNLIQEYEKRIKHFCDLAVVEVKSTQSATREQSMLNEGERLLEKIDRTDYVVVLDAGGESPSTEQFSKFMAEHQDRQLQNLVFVVGGHWGLVNDIKSRANRTLSLSKMTFNHEMIRLFLLEQIYRAFTIIHHFPYHK
jgi:23S rRNA (pseudouridine1915-N3)-methyltransferase